MRLTRLLFVLLFLLTSVFALVPVKTTITDVLYAPDGSLMNGRIKITNTTFTSADGYAVEAGSISINIVAGALSTALVPNAGSSPTGTSYRVDFFLDAVTTRVNSTEFWIVPSSGSPVALAALRILSPPVTAILVAMSQVTPPVPCTDQQTLAWIVSSSTWQCVTPTTATLLWTSVQLSSTNNTTIWGQWTPSKAIVVTRVQASAIQVANTCTVYGTFVLTDGTTTITFPVTNGTQFYDSGIISQNYSAGTLLQVKVGQNSSGCTAPMANAVVNVQYKMQ